MTDTVKKLRSAGEDICADGPLWPGDVMLVAADEMDRLREAIGDALDDMGAKDRSVCEAVKAKLRFAYGVDEENFLQYSMEEAVKTLLEVELISPIQAEAALEAEITKAEGKL